MKRIAFLSWFMQWTFLFAQKDSFYLLTPVEVKAVRAGEMAPLPKPTSPAASWPKSTWGRISHFCSTRHRRWSSMPTHGNGISYTSLHASAVPMPRVSMSHLTDSHSDAESQGRFLWTFRFSSSVGSIQIQRGVGTSSNGAGAFGASIIQHQRSEPGKLCGVQQQRRVVQYLEKHDPGGTGLINDHFTADLRLSRVSSDGYIDRATSRLGSYYFSAAYLAAKVPSGSTFFSGHEKPTRPGMGSARQIWTRETAGLIMPERKAGRSLRQRNG